MPDTRRAWESPGGITVRLIDFDKTILEEEEWQFVDFIRDWFLVDLTMPTLQDMADHQELPIAACQKLTVTIRKKTGLEFPYQIPFLKNDGTETRFVPFIPIKKEFLKNRFYKEKPIWPNREEEILRATRDQFFQKLTVPTWKDIDRLMGRKDSLKGYYAEQFRMKAGVSRLYQLPFLPLNDQCPPAP
ncbi:MAG TPA: hypothetical protein VMU07_02640 [Candidatus Paceibacterota bacterium]|nr:hypothetical protein [Candidatus Paceibacterota bacterium]